MSACIGTPISWLRLEQYQAGELDRGERRAISEHLAACAVCAACAKEIENDARALPVLPRPKTKVFTLRRIVPIASAIAVAAAIFVFVGQKPVTPVEPDLVRVKGNDISFALVREDEGTIGEAGGTFRDGDRFKALVTCPPGMRGSFDVVVYEHGDVSFPLAAQSDVACGNSVALPGAFRLTGKERMNICLVWSEGAVDRAEIARTPAELLPRARCTMLEPAP